MFSSYSLFVFQISFYCMGFFPFFLCHFSRSCSLLSFFSFSCSIGFSCSTSLSLIRYLLFFSTPFLIFLCSSRSPFSSISCFIPLFFFCLFSLFCFFLSFFGLLYLILLYFLLFLSLSFSYFWICITFSLSSSPFSWTHSFWDVLEFPLRILICHFFLHLSFGIKAFDIKISLWVYFLCTSLPLYCPSSFFIIFRMCHLFCLLFFLLSFFIAVFLFFSAYFYLGTTNRSETQDDVTKTQAERNHR